MNVGDLVEAKFKQWLRLDTGILIDKNEKKVIVFWFCPRMTKRTHFIEEVRILEKK